MKATAEKNYTGIKGMGDCIASSPYGIPLDGETMILPGLSNSFELYEASGWLKRNRYLVLFALFTSSQIVLTGVWDRFDLAQNDDFDAIPITMDFGDLRVRKPAAPAVEFDEVFGNEFVKEAKKKERFDPQTGEDSRIAGAVNPYQANVSPPVDLNPEILPDYPPAARSAGIQGTVTLELVVSDEGEVLRAKPVGKALGMGLGEAAAAAFRKKRYRPSIDASGRAFTVKFYQPVRFVLN